jgi:hypothetical protein
MLAQALGEESLQHGRTMPFEEATVEYPADAMLAYHQQAERTSDVFHRLRWGGRVVMVHREAHAVLDLIHRYQDHEGFALEQGVHGVHMLPFGLQCPLRLPGLTRDLHYAVARKLSLLEPGERTDRFTFEVRLERVRKLGRGYVVSKTVPKYRMVVDRLRERFPDATEDVLMQRADKLVKRVFPVFLTREAGFLQLLQRDLPPEYRSRVPVPLGIEKAADGTVRKLYMTWLRLSGEPMTQLDFAEQSADLLRVLHDSARIMHLDLRLDNIVIHQGSVCFIDFGSAVRLTENLETSPMLRSLFNEMMQASQIQRQLGKMKEQGYLTSDVLLAAHGKVDKGVDLFYLALQIAKPHWNPDLVPFIQHHPDSDEAHLIKNLSRSILRPSDPNHNQFKSAADILAGLQQIRQELRS